MRSPLLRANQVWPGASALAVAACAVACGREAPVLARAAARVQVRGFTEATAVRELHAAPPFVVSVTDAGLERWDLRGGAAQRIGTEVGLPAGALIAHDLDDARRGLWLATDTSLARYDIEAGVVTEVPAPPDVLGLTSLAGATLGAADDGGVWIGLPRGLYYATARGEWTPTAVTAPVTDVVEQDGDLWVGTALGLYVSHRGGPAVLLGRDRGCDVAAVRQLVAAPDGGALVLGDSLSGAQRVVLARPSGCDSYRVSPARAWQALASRPGEVLILSDRQVYALARPWSPVRRLARDGLRLLPVPRADGTRPKASPFVLRSLEVPVPPGARALAAAGTEVLVGTDSLGIARLATRGRQVAWLRARELAEGARALSVACRTRDDCWVATGGRRAWRFDGKGFRALADDERPVLAVVAGPVGEVHGLLAAGSSVVIADPVGDGWKDTGTAIETPGTAAELAFARMSPAGVLWVGLRYRDDDGDVRPHGVALVDVGLGLVAYHHASPDEREARRGILPIPIDVADVAFIGEESWLATSEGAAQVRGDQVRVFSEADGMGSEILHGVACTAGGMVYAATAKGVAAFDGERWTEPARLTGAVNDLALGLDGRLWLATDRGVAVYDGARLRRLDRRRGLLEDRVLDLAIDRFGRVWVRGAEGIALVEP